MYLTLWWITDYNPSTGEVTTQGGDYPIKNLNFSPQTDLTGNSLPINEYTCDVITEGMYGGVTTDAITHELRDDLDRLWAGWQIYKAIRISDTCVRVTCRSWINELDYIQMPETGMRARPHRPSSGRSSRTAYCGRWPTSSKASRSADTPRRRPPGRG